ncbi:MAG TPA: aminotransferase class V-fold PLP-dependent enzyme, partial [Acidimicrobiales bacterium]|nr:aminotransferase class V-fold PLP-dependent enzyme [Acidimicrobiales bacterium]
VTISAHKIGGPKGAGALVVRRSARERVEPILLGGGQERALRAGTENVAAIVGFGVAAAASEPDPAATGALRDRLAEGIVAGVPAASVTASGATRSPGILHLRFPGVSAEELLVLLDDADVAASAGSACASGALEPSHVLSAMGWDDRAAKEAIRFSLGRTTDAREIEVAIGATVESVRRLSNSGAR